MEETIKREDIEKAGNSLIIYSSISLLFNALKFSTGNIHDFPIIVTDQKLAAGVVTSVALYFFLYFILLLLRSYLLESAASYSESLALIDKAVEKRAGTSVGGTPVHDLVIADIRAKINSETARYRVFTGAFVALTQFVPITLGLLALGFGWQSLIYLFSAFFALF